MELSESYQAVFQLKAFYQQTDITLDPTNVYRKVASTNASRFVTRPVY